MHRIDADTALKSVSAASRVDADFGFFMHLRDLGRHAARTWLKSHYEAIGKHGTLDLRETIS